MERKMTNKDRADAYLMRLEGASFREIAKKYGVSFQYLQNILPAVNPRKKSAYHCIYPAIANYLRENNLSCAGFAKSAGVGAVTITETLKGAHSPSKKTIDAILRITGLTYEEAFREKDEAGN